MSNPSSENQTPSTNPKPGASVSRSFWVGMSVFMIVLVFIGFWPSYFTSLFLGREPVKFAMMEIFPAIHLHAAVSVGWLVLLLAQTVLAARGRIRAHMAVGRWGVLFGVGVFVVAAFIMFLKYELLVAQGRTTWLQAPAFVWTMPSWITLLQFAILLTVGYLYRTSPQVHKRFMIFAGLAMISAATDRMGFLGPWWTVMPAVVVAPVWAYDLRVEGRIHPATLVGSLIVVSTSIHWLLK